MTVSRFVFMTPTRLDGFKKLPIRTHVYNLKTKVVKKEKKEENV